MLGSETKEVVVPSAIEVVPSVEADLAQLFLLARGAFADLPGWSDERVLEVLRLDIVCCHGIPCWAC